MPRVCKVYSRPSDELVLGQLCRRLTSIEPAMGCDTGPPWNRNLVGIVLQIIETIVLQIGVKAPTNLLKPTKQY